MLFLRPNAYFTGRNGISGSAIRQKPRSTGREAIELAHQNHFGSQCATERVYRHLPANVELTKSHFGKQSLTECTLRHPPCQSELAEARAPPLQIADAFGAFVEEKVHYG